MSNKEYGKITIKEVAKLADISITTVSHYLNGTKSVSAATRSRIKAAITQLDYLPNANAQSLKQQKTHMVGVIIPDMIIYGFICQHIEMFLYEHGYSVIVCNTCFDQTRENMQIKALVQKRVDGIIIASSGGNNDLIRSIHESGIPIILFDRFFEQLPDMNYVLERSDECLTKIVENALRLGHRRMAYIKGPDNSVVSESRFKRFREILAENDIEELPQYYYHNRITQEQCMEAVDHILAHRDDVTVAITTNANQIKYFAMRCHENGICVPDDISLTGFGVEEYKTLFTIPISCLIQNHYEIALHSAKLLMEVIRHKEKHKGLAATKIIYVDSEFFDGKSVKDLRKKDK